MSDRTAADESAERRERAIPHNPQALEYCEDGQWRIVGREDAIGVYRETDSDREIREAFARMAEEKRAAREKRKEQERAIREHTEAMQALAAEMRLTRSGGSVSAGGALEADGAGGGVPEAERAAGGGERVPVGLTRADCLVLKALCAERSGRLLTIEAIAEYLRVERTLLCDKSIGASLRRLIAGGLADRPEGPKRGAIATIAGRRQGAMIPQ